MDTCRTKASAVIGTFQYEDCFKFGAIGCAYRSSDKNIWFNNCAHSEGTVSHHRPVCQCNRTGDSEEGWSLNFSIYFSVSYLVSLLVLKILYGFQMWVKSLTVENFDTFFPLWFSDASKKLKCWEILHWIFILIGMILDHDDYDKSLQLKTSTYIDMNLEH